MDAEFWLQRWQDKQTGFHLQEVRDLFSSRWSIRRVYDEDILAREPRFRERGLSRMNEKVYLLNKQ
ncbi:MAG TPA: hypothetical protein ENI74_00535 [Gammaproteobacteria bacterium]|nr:hypothetical protein [Gammaproteobacteria bacterium]